MSQQVLKILLAGSPALALPSFQALLDDQRYQILGLLTQSDQPAGRGLKLTPPPAKTWALKNNLSIWQPIKLKNWQSVFESINPDLVVVIAYGQLVPSNLLSQPPYGWLNVHGSLLPKYRGAGVLSAPILNGDRVSGWSLIKLVKELDAGPIIGQSSIELVKDETMGSLADKIANDSAKYLPDMIINYIDGQLIPQPQNHDLATYVGRVLTSDTQVNWLKSALEIERSVRAYQPSPGAWTIWNNCRLKIIKTQVDLSINLPPGLISKINGQLVVGTGQGGLIIEALQLSGRPIVSGAQFLLGHPEIVNKQLN